MGSLLKYSGIATKIRAMKSRLLTDEEYQEIAELNKVTEIAGYLKKKPAYASLLKDVDEQNMHRGQLEEVISSATFEDYDSLYCFANHNQRKFLQIYSERFEIKLLKNCMTDLFSKGQIQESSVRYQGFFDKHTTLNLKKIRMAKDMHTFIESLSGTNYYKPLHQIEVSERKELQDYEIVLDFFHFSRVWKSKEKILEKRDRELIEKEYGSKFDMLNVHWIYRAKHYYKMTDAEIYSIIIPLNYKIRKQDIKNLVEAETEEDFEKLLKASYYGRRFSELKNDTIEEMYRYILKHTLQEDAKKNPYSMAIVYSYLYHKEHEISRLIVEIESIRYQVDMKTTMDHIRKA